MQNKTTISVRLNNDEIEKLRKEASERHTTVSKLAKERIVRNCGCKVMSPDVFVTLTGVYNILSIDPAEWNKEMKRTVKSGLRRLHDVCKEG